MCQEQILSNRLNEKNLINILIGRITTVNITTKVARDADTDVIIYSIEEILIC